MGLLSFFVLEELFDMILLDLARHGFGVEPSINRNKGDTQLVCDRLLGDFML